MTEEPTHGSWIGKLDAYLDSELDSSQMEELDRHLRQCPECTAEVLRRLQWKRAIHSAGQCYVPGAGMRERIQGSISPASQRGGTGGQRSPSARPCCCCLL